MASSGVATPGSPDEFSLDSPPGDGISSVEFAKASDLLLVSSWDEHIGQSFPRVVIIIVCNDPRIALSNRDVSARYSYLQL